MNLDNIDARKGLFVTSKQLYSFDGTSIYISDKEGQEKEKIDFTQEYLDKIEFKFNKEVLIFSTKNILKAVYLPTLRSLIDEEFKEELTALSISPSAMNSAIGFSNGKAMIFSTLLGSSLSKFSLFSDGSSIEHIGFLRDEIIYSATKEKIVITDLLKKTTVSNILSQNSIKKIYTSENSLVYTTSANEIYFVDLQEIKIPKKSVLSDLSAQVIDIKFSSCNKNLYVALMNKIVSINIEFQKITLIKDGLKDIVNLSLDKDDTIFVAHKDSSQIIKTSKKKDVELVVESSDKSKKNEKIVRFLTADDSRTIRMVIKRSIINNFENVEVGEAIDGVDTLKYLKENLDTDVIFLDWNMPRMNGDEVVEEIAKIPELKHLKIIMATTEGGKDKVKAMISKGVIGYLVKPLKAESVNPLAKKMIEIVQAQRSLDV